MNPKVALLGMLSGVYSAAAMGPLETLCVRDTQIREVLGARKQVLNLTQNDRLRELVGGIFDYEAHTRESFGRHWHELGEDGRKEAVRLLTTLVERSSMEKVHEYHTERIQYVAERIDASNPCVALVTTRITRGSESWELAYRMGLTAGQWRIVDIVVEGASSIENNRLVFNKEIRTSGIQGLLDKLRRKVEAQP